MSTIKEDYVSFEIAKLLKEKGFDGECRDYYNTDGHFYSEDFKSNWNDNRVQIPLFSASTHQMVTKWLREVHHLWIDINLLTGYKCTWTIWLMNDPNLKMGESSRVISNYKEATEEAIKYCLENLII